MALLIVTHRLVSNGGKILAKVCAIFGFEAMQNVETMFVNNHIYFLTRP
jgi:hypothetical protein